MIVSPRVTSPHATDFSSLSALVGSPRFEGKAGQDLAAAIWEFLVDPVEGLYHFWPSEDRLTAHAVNDPLKILNCFGWAICGQNATVLANLFKAAGFEDARTVGIKGHVVPEVYYDGAWHLLDGDLKAYHRKRPPNADQIASVAECVADRTLVSDQPNRSDPYYVADRTPQAMAGLYDVEPRTGPLFSEWAHTMDFILRPGESLRRNTFPEGKYVWFDGWTESVQRFKTEWNDGPWERHEPHRRYGNGLWLYRPNLTDACRDVEAGALEIEGFAPSVTGLSAGNKGPNACVFEFNSPWVFTGTPGRNGAKPTDGCILEATVHQQDASSAMRIDIAVGPLATWETVWTGPGTGTHNVKLDLTEHVANAYRYLLRFACDASGPDACRLESLSVASSIMVAPASVGRLVEGANDLTVRFGDEHGQRTRRLMIETSFRDPPEVRAKAHRLENLYFQPDTADRIRPIDRSRDYEIVFKVDAPPQGRLKRIYAFGSYRCADPQAGNTDCVATYWAASESGRWHPLYEGPVPTDAQRWHFSRQGEATLRSPVPTVFVKFVGKVGMNNAKVRVHWLDDRTRRIHTPLLVDHVWEEGSGCCKMHSERIGRSDRPHQYQIICGPGPALRTLGMRASSAPA